MTGGMLGALLAATLRAQAPSTSTRDARGGP